jgi:photosystem II stability/assembly factor-like uncharacterized protein
MRILKISLLVFILSITISAQETGWFWQNPLPQGNFLTDLTFVDSLNGWAVGYFGTVLKTSNGGINWQSVDRSFDNYLRKVSFVNTQNGWVMDYYSNVFRTTDGGISWDHLSLITNFGTIIDFKMVNDTIGFACGSDSNLYKTINGGMSWELLQTPFYISLGAIEFVNQNLGWTGGYSPYILKTTNGGITWSYFSLPIDCVFSINFNNSNLGCLSGVLGNQGVVFITADGGNNWILRFVGSSVANAYFSNLQIGWANNWDGTLYKTINGGSSWEEKAYNCSKFYFLNNYNSWGLFDLNRIFYSDNGWDGYDEQIQSVTAEYLQSITIKDSLNIFICGQKNIIGTSDGGKNWSIYFSSSANQELNSITAINNYVWAVGNFGQVVCSKDNGNSFENFYLPAYWLSDVYFIDDNKGFIVGGNIEGEFFLTTDAGLTWDSLETAPQSEGFNKIKFSSDSIGFMSSKEGIYKSLDQGNTWQLVKTGYFLPLESIGNSIWTASINEIIVSTDLGQIWNTIEVYEINSSVSNIESISFIDENNGWISVSDGRIYKSSDGGFNWNEEDRLAGVSLNSVKFYKNNCGWAAGSGGIILHYGDETTNITEEKYTLIESYNLSQNFPNPFNPSTTIRYEIPQQSFVTIKIYDVLGNEIATLVNEEKPAGEYEVEFSAKGGSASGGNAYSLPSGVYFYTLSSGNFFSTKKMILLR